MRRSVLLAVATVFVLAGCDSAEALPTEVPPVGTVRVVAPVDRIGINRDGAVGSYAQVSLTGLFEADAQAGALRYEATSDVPDVASVTVEKGLLTLRRLGAGRAQIRVTARSESGATAATEFTVRVRAPLPPSACPPGPSANQADFFPLEAGRVWTYNYVSRSRYGQEVTSRSGTYTYTFLSNTCLQGVRRTEFELHRVFREIGNGGGAGVPPDTTYIDDRSSNSITETAAGLDLTQYGLGWEGSVPRFHPSERETVHIGNAPGSYNTRYLDLQREHAPAEEGRSSLGSSSHDNSAHLTLVSESSSRR